MCSHAELAGSPVCLPCGLITDQTSISHQPCGGKLGLATTSCSFPCVSSRHPNPADAIVILNSSAIECGGKLQLSKVFTDMEQESASVLGLPPLLFLSFYDVKKSN